MDIILKYFIYGILLFLIKECRADIKINSLSVPSRYELKNDHHRLVLDCDYMVDENEKGFVLKWHRDNVQIYQWIPNRQPYALGAFKGRLDLAYESESDNRLKKHSALVILDPLTSDSGNFTCNVQSFQSSDKQTAEMIVYDPADQVNVKYSIDQIDQVVNLDCTVINIYPIPQVKFLFDNQEKPLQAKNETKSGENSYNVTLTAQISKSEIEDESEVACVVEIPSVEYERIETIIYDDPKQTPSYKKSMSGEYKSDANIDENFAHRIASSLNLLIIVMIAVVLGR